MKNISIRRKFSLVAGTCLLLALSAIVGFSLYHSGQTQALIRDQTLTNLRQSARTYTEAMVAEQAQVVQSVIERNLFRGEVLANSLLFMRSDAMAKGVDSAELRRSLSLYLKRMAVQHRDLLGVYVVMDTDTLNGEDSLYADSSRLASNSVGRFTPYWYRGDGGEVELEVIAEEELSDTSLNQYGIAESEWYTCAINSRKACVLDPYLDDVGTTELLMTSVTLPLLDEGQVIGMLGLDISLASLQPMIERVDGQFMEGAGEVALFSQAGLLVAHDQGRTRLGSPIQALSLGTQTGIGAWLKSPTKLIEWSRDNTRLQATMPISFRGVDEPWGLVASVPAERVLASALELDAAVAQQNATATREELIAAAVIAVIALVLVWGASHYLVNPIWKVTRRLQSIASGEWDLTQRLTLETGDEIGILADRFNQFLEKLQTTVQLIDESVHNGQATSARASEIAVRTSGSSQQQFLAVEQVATALEQMTATASSVSENAAQAATAADEAKGAAVEGRQVATQTGAAVQSLVGDVSAAMPMVEKLAQDSENIESILAVIQGIAEQTNLLALNAAIEAARAGEQGRGFAVVASEVRGLAERTQNSIGEIRALIEVLQSGSRSVVSAISSGNDKARDTLSQVNEMNSALAVIVDHIQHITENGAEIANLAAEQSSVANEISLNVTNIREASRSITEEAESSAALSEELQQLSEQQRGIVTQFKV
ncbi:methyl-accepting chemotaxis sensory transducer with Cache sensor [Ferrimonas sediminum]|uniref:Methyl-accepting chemotaxis sensory transducer with Cache sensor n=1 Tax=Ferrimonas sediminum TaxID=718193 RepID=A0A1G8UGE3_9GAMM|nr:methyl-accepting chemotaxis protein [Ferrimonas sediminum]SDJ52060.1 methyl-accepting chemotaxis sensory transducer with Cache sensor [Ferrimonas sediminum]